MDGDLGTPAGGDDLDDVEEMKPFPPDRERRGMRRHSGALDPRDWGDARR
jgi:hypothetical protein